MIVFLILLILLIMPGMAAFIIILFLAYGDEPTSTRNHKSNKKYGTQLHKRNDLTHE